MCNMRCTYCFENFQDQKSYKIISEEIIIKSVDFLVNSNKINYHITFFGGEPLLCGALIKFTIDYANKIAKHRGIFMGYSVVTNGTLLDDKYLNMLNENNVNIVLSFDGDPIFQDKYRPLTNGKSSYNIIIEYLHNLFVSRKGVQMGHTIVRPTLTKEAIPQLVNIYNNLVALGCEEISFSLVSAKDSDEYAIDKNDLSVLEEQYSKLADIYMTELKNGISRNKFFESILKKIHRGYTNEYFCDCGKRFIAIGVDGNIYPCEGFIGIDKFTQGNVLDNTLINNNMRMKSIHENEQCQNCWAKYLCGGSCYHEAWMRTDSLDGRDITICKTYEIAFKIALSLYINIKESGLINVFEEISVSTLPIKSVPVVKNTVLNFKENFIFTSNNNIFTIISLNEIAQQVFNMCNNKNSLYNIIEEIEKMYDCDKNIIYKDVSRVLEKFLDEDIITLTI